MAKRYISAKADFITHSFDLQSGHKQKGRRPAIVVSNFLFNKATGMTIVCPDTNRRIPFHLPVPKSSSLTGFVMVEQVKSIDFKFRQARFVEEAPQDLIDDVLAVIDVCVK